MEVLFFYKTFIFFFSKPRFLFENWLYIFITTETVSAYKSKNADKKTLKIKNLEEIPKEVWIIHSLVTFFSQNYTQKFCDNSFSINKF